MHHARHDQLVVRGRGMYIFSLYSTHFDGIMNTYLHKIKKMAYTNVDFVL
jgi:hypothetical protein